MSTLCTLRDSVISYLNGLGLTPNLTAVAAYSDAAGLEQLNGGRLLVIARQPHAELLTFEADEERKPVIDVVVQYHGQTLNAVELDPYFALSETITDKLLTAANGAFDGMTCIEADWPLPANEGAFVQSDLANFNALTCLTRYKFYG